VFVRQGRTVHELSLAQGGASGGLEVELRFAPLDEATMAELARFGTEITRVQERVRMRVADEQVLPHVVSWLVGRGLKVYELRCHRRSLEEWFVEIMGQDHRPG
jgi:hypothetical protein